MIIKVEHIGIAVENLQKANLLFAVLLGKEPYKMEEVSSEKVNTSFFQVGEIKVELLEGMAPDSAITKFLQKKGEGIHHIAFEVPDIRLAMEALKDGGFQLLNDEPKKGADNKLVCFIHPRSSHGVLVELCQSLG